MVTRLYSFALAALASVLNRSNPAPVAISVESDETAYAVPVGIVRWTREHKETRTGNARPGATWGKRYVWRRNVGGTVSVYNPRTGVLTTFRNVGDALRVARAHKAGKGAEMGAALALKGEAI